MPDERRRHISSSGGGKGNSEHTEPVPVALSGARSASGRQANTPAPALPVSSGTPASIAENGPSTVTILPSDEPISLGQCEAIVSASSGSGVATNWQCTYPAIGQCSVCDQLLCASHIILHSLEHHP